MAGNLVFLKKEMKIVRHLKSTVLVKHGIIIKNWHCMLYLRIDYMISIITADGSITSVSKERFPRGLL